METRAPPWCRLVTAQVVALQWAAARTTPNPTDVQSFEESPGRNWAEDDGNSRRSRVWPGMSWESHKAKNSVLSHHHLRLPKSKCNLNSPILRLPSPTPPPPRQHCQPSAQPYTQGSLAHVSRDTLVAQAISHPISSPGHPLVPERDLDLHLRSGRLAATRRKPQAAPHRSPLSSHCSLLSSARLPTSAAAAAAGPLSVPAATYLPESYPNFDFPACPLPTAAARCSPRISSLPFLCRLQVPSPSCRSPPLRSCQPPPSPPPVPPPLLQPDSLPESLLMSSISLNNRLKGFGFGKRKSTASIQSPDLPQTRTPPPPGAPQLPPLFPSRPGPAPSIASTSSQQSLPMNHPGPGARPPSYSANYPPGPPPGAVGRTSPLNQGQTRTPPSQMVGGPPPINTGGPPAGYPPPVMGGPPPIQGGPPGYAGAPGYPPPPPQQQQGPGAAPYGRQSAAEVEGNSRSKAQLIVGIDFVRPRPPLSLLLRSTVLTARFRRARRSPVWPLPLPRTMRPRKTSLPSGQEPDRIPNKR